MKFSRKFLVGDLGLPNACAHGAIVSDQVIRNGRWHTHELLFRLESQPIDEAWKTFYTICETDATDAQVPWKYTHEVECVRVRLVEELAIVIKVDKGESIFLLSDHLWTLSSSFASSQGDIVPIWKEVPER